MDEDEKQPLAGDEQENNPPKKRRSKTLRRILTGILTLLLIVLAVLVFLFRDALTGEGLRALFGRERSGGEVREAYTYETGAEQIFAPVGDGLAVASSSSLQLLQTARCSATWAEKTACSSRWTGAAAIFLPAETFSPPL